MTAIEALELWLIVASAARWKCENVKEFDALITEYENRLALLRLTTGTF